MAIRSTFGLLFKGEFARFVHRLSLKLPEFFSFNRYFFMATDNLNLGESFNENVVVKLATSEDVDILSAISKRKKNTVEYLIKKDNIKAFLAGEKGEPYSCSMWSSIGYCYVVGAGWEYDFGDKMTYIFWSLNSPEKRGKGIYLKSLNELVNYHKRNGVEKFSCLVEFDNQPSIKLHNLLGYKTIQTITTMRIFSIKFTRVKNHNNSHKSFRIFIKFPPKATII